MFFFFPINTDAPIYHYPIATVALIAVNTLMFFGTGMGAETALSEALVLQFNEINPLQWITVNFMHAGVMHLVGNMIFLWPYGLLVEGKLGWYRFLGVYLLIGVVHGATVQLVMYRPDATGYALGASAVLFGLLALCIVWAPKNNFTCFYFYWLFLRFGTGTVAISVLTLGMIFVALECVGYFLADFGMSSAALHLTGFAVGFPLGLLMLKMKWVDCEGWDLIAVWKGTARGKLAYEIREEAEAAFKQSDEVHKETVQQEQAQALQLLRDHATAGRGKVAYAVYQKTAGEDGSLWELPEKELSGLVSAMQKEKLYSESVPLLVELVGRFPERAAPARLLLAQILVQVERRPRQALAVLEKLPAGLPDAHQVRRQNIAALAAASIEEGELEMPIEEW